MIHRNTASAASILDHPLHLRRTVPLVIALVALPLLATAMGEQFYVGLASRILIFALAASSLNLILGFCGLVSFGHSAFLGIGAYAVGILASHGVDSLWVALPLSCLAAALFAMVIGAISLRTQGVYFIMITLAFAQMLYFLVISLKAYGGDDGLSLATRSHIGFGVDLADDTTFYYLVLSLFLAAMFALHRLLNARFGHVIQGIRENETRMRAMGYPVFRYQLLAFVIAGAIAGLAGALHANQSSFVSPSVLQWHQSGVLMVMVILGGVGHLYGGVVGAIIFLLLEEIISSYTIHWQIGLGAVLLTVVLAAPAGLLSLMRRKNSS